MLHRLQHSTFADTASHLLHVDATPRVMVAVMIISSALGLGALALGLKMIFVVLGVLLPWAPVLAHKIAADRLRYGWLAIFELLVVLQIAHFAEHVSQMVEIHLLSWPAVLARGIIGDLDIEPVHWWWNTAILFAATLLLLRYKNNGWLWGSWVFSVWHEVEHAYIYFWWFLPKGISGHPGILGAGGILDEANISLPYLTTLTRPDLHFWYNLFEIGLFGIAFLAQAQRLIQTRSTVPLRGAPDLRRILVLAGGVQVAALTVAGLIYYSPAELQVPGSFSTIQNAIDYAPDWAIIRVGPGTYNEALRITKPITLMGIDRNATHIGIVSNETPVITVSHTHDVTLKNLSIDGGLYGVLVEESESIQVINNTVSDAWFAGIRITRAQANIQSNQIVGTRSPYGMGIELANTVQKAATVIRNNLVRGHPQEGIDTHNANAMIVNNIVENSGRRGIAITEMSMATLRGNRVHGFGEMGIFVVDHSMAELEHNQVIDPHSTAEGVCGDYYAELMFRWNTIQSARGRELVLKNGATLEPWP